MNDYGIEAHKLFYHPLHLQRFLSQKDIYPIYIEIAPSGGCNHRCIFCALDYLKYSPVFLDTKVLKQFITDIAKKGVKSLMFAGEGEPLLHKDIADLVRYARRKKIDVAITTNGVLLDKHHLEDILKNLSWLRVSINASTPKSYGRIHRTRTKDFNTVLANLKKAVRLKRKKRYPCTIGAQFLLLKQNYKEAIRLARILKRIGLDYLIIKPYSQHPLSFNRLKRTFSYRSLDSLQKQLAKLCDKRFKVIFRKHTMEKLNRPRPYNRCLGIDFWSYLDSSGNLYACSSFLGDKRFYYGNIYKERFAKIWKGKKRKEIKKMMRRWDTRRCREVCRLDEINRYLWELTHPEAHVNFI